MNQEQKDTIREEFRVTFPYLELNTNMEDWWLLMLEEAYQQGAKDKVEEVRGDIKQIFFNDECFYSDIHKKMLLSLESLKDNT
jgi:hypothetical protein